MRGRGEEALRHHPLQLQDGMDDTTSISIGCERERSEHPNPHAHRATTAPPPPLPGPSRGAHRRSRCHPRRVSRGTYRLPESYSQANEAVPRMERPERGGAPVWWRPRGGGREMKPSTPDGNSSTVHPMSGSQPSDRTCTADISIQDNWKRAPLPLPGPTAPCELSQASGSF